MLQIPFEGLAAYAVLDRAGREDYAVSQAGGAIADYEIFGQIMAQLGEAAHGSDHFAAGGEGWSEGEIHFADEPRYQHAGEKFCVHADSLKARPESLSRHRAVGTRDYTPARVLELSCDAPQQVRRNVY